MITTIPELNEFLAAKDKRLASEQRDLDHAEALQMNAQFDRIVAELKERQTAIEEAAMQQLAAARALEQETATVGVVETPQSKSVYVGHAPSDEEIVSLVADEYGMTFLEAISRMQVIAFKELSQPIFLQG